jgi:isopenicillin-N N-acyltransferase-like protein
MKKRASSAAIATVLDLNYAITLPYTNKKYYEEMRGISEGSGVDFNFFKRIHMIGELTKGSCSMFGAWGKATTNGQTVQLRALDWVIMKIYRISMVLTISILW